MSVTLSYYLESVNAEMDDGWTTLRLYRDTTPDGSFATLVDSETLVEDQTDYEFTDATGTANHWYRVGLYDGSSLSTLSDPFRPNATTLLSVILEAAKIADAGFDSVCTAEGDTNLLIDAVLLDHGVDDKYQESAYIYRPSAAAADQMRRVSGFNTSQGGFIPSRDWASGPSDDEVYHLYLLLPPFSYAGAPYSWASAARDALQECYSVDQVDIGVGTANRDTRFSLGTHLGYLKRESIRRVFLRTFDSNLVPTDQDASKNGRFWEALENGSELSLHLSHAPKTTEHIIVELDRRYAEIFDPDDVTSCPLRLAAKATAWKVYEHLNEIHPGKYKSEVASAKARFLRERGDLEGVIDL